MVVILFNPSFAYGWWQGYNAGWEDSDDFSGSYETEIVNRIGYDIDDRIQKEL